MNDHGSKLAALAFSPAQLAVIDAIVAERISVAFADYERGRDRQRWLSSDQAAAYLGCSRTALYRRIRRGRIPPDAIRHHGRSLLIDRLALDRHLEHGTPC